MSLQHAESGTARRSTARVWFWTGLALLAIAIFPIAYRNWVDWREDERLRDTSLSFLRDVSAGRKGQALRYLASETRWKVEQNWEAEFDRVWEATDDLSLRVMSVAREGEMAEVRVSVSKSGFSIDPLLHLRRNGNGNWKITRIDHVDIDPRWRRYQEQQAESAAAEIADELAQKLDGN